MLEAARLEHANVFSFQQTSPLARTPMTEQQRTELFERELVPHMKAIRALALRLCRNPDDADDLVQETYLKAFRFLDSFSPGTNAKAWLTTILKNTFINKYRAEQRTGEAVSYEEIEDFYESLRPDEIPSNDAITQQLDQILDDEVMAALNALSDEFRTVVILCDIEDFSYEEAAEFIGCPVGTVRSRLHRARAALAKQLLSYARRQGFSVANAVDRFDISSTTEGDEQ
ncbi:MAG: sigma-70 family RNA polymerase sigma factor [Candidatus Kapabacteria bacterium]|nr:sigma-70 family RNA polymerase sigma factor [Candidatus Kapabacteria bacterium]